MSNASSNTSHGNGKTTQHRANNPTDPRTSTATTIRSSGGSMLSQGTTGTAGTQDMYKYYHDEHKSGATSRDSSANQLFGISRSAVDAAAGAIGGSGQTSRRSSQVHSRPTSRQGAHTPRPSTASSEDISIAFRQSPGSATGGARRASGVSDQSSRASRDLQIGMNALELGNRRPSPPRTAEEERRENEKAKRDLEMVKKQGESASGERNRKKLEKKDDTSLGMVVNSGTVSGRKRGKAYGEKEG